MKTIKQRSQASERAAARLIGGRMHPASGALSGAGVKGDVSNDEILLEDKTTAAGSYSLKFETFRKVQREALHAGKKPVLRINFEGRAPVYVIDEQTFMDLL